MDATIFLKDSNVVVQTATQRKLIPTNKFSIDPNGENMSIYNDNDVNRTFHFSEVTGIDDSGASVTFSSVLELEDYLSPFVNFKNGGGNGNTGVATGYVPDVKVNSIFPSIISANTTTLIEVKGSFLDYVTGASMTAGDDSGSLISIVSKTFDVLILEIISNNIEQFYNITLVSPNETEVFSLESKNFTSIIPSTTGTGTSLWTQSGTNNLATIGNGTFEAQDAGGDGWNEHAAFGPVSSTDRMEFEFKVERLTGASTGYSYIATGTTNTPTTGGNPRVYIQNGTTFLVYSPAGTSITTTIAVDDVITIILEPNKYEVLKNGVSIFDYTGAVVMNNIYMNFTAYRVVKFNSINAKIF